MTDKTDIEKLIKLLEHAESFSLEAYGKSPNLSECSLNIQYLRACILQAIGNAKALRARLAQPEQEPVACIVKGCSNHRGEGRFIGALCSPCHTFITTGEGKYSQAYHNSQREWQGLTDEEIYECEKVGAIHYQRHKCSVRGQQLTPADDPQWHFAGAIEAKLKEKND